MATDLLYMLLALAGLLAGAGAMFAVISRNPGKTMDKPHD